MWTGFFAGLGMLCLILDAKTALDGAGDGIRLCIYSVVPALFPFLVLSILLTGALSGGELPILRPLERLCGIPAGAGYLLIMGLLGGYPVGAQAIAQLCRENMLSQKDGTRMLGFCSNAGPAFIFGIAASQFTDPSVGWKLWGIHILSALAVGMLLPGRPSGRAASAMRSQITVTEAMNRAVRVMAQICGWVVVLRVVMAFLQKWLLWLLPKEWQVLISGLLELTNGCLALSGISSEELRFVIASAMLAFGGVCVLMQTGSVTGKLGLGMYLPGKLLQTGISVLLAVLTVRSGILPVAVLAIAGIFCREMKKRSGNSRLIGV